jgi:hypothetical protein
MRLFRVCTVVLALAVFGVSVSCGIDDYKYLSPASLVNSTLNSNAVIRLPDGSTVTINFINGQIPTVSIPGGLEFGREYEIYYRIYLSDKLMDTVNTDSARQDVNSTLAADWTAMYSYTVDSNNLSSSVASLFSGRKYYSLQIGSSSHAVRSNGNGAFDPKPADRLFTTSDDLFNSDYLTSSINADVAPAKSGVTPEYAYASMYVVMRDFNPQTLNPVYSSITFINIFLLPSGAGLQNIPATGVTISQVSSQPAAVKLRAAVAPDNASDKTVVWTIDNMTVADIRPLADSTAIVYSKAAPPGTVIVTATTTGGAFSASYTVSSLFGIAATELTLAPATLNLSVSGSTVVGGVTYPRTGTLAVNVLPSNADDKNVTWLSSDPSIATVNNAGIVTALARSATPVTITATTTDGTELTRACTVTVVN